MSSGNCTEYLKKINNIDVEEKRKAITELSNCNDIHILKILAGHFSDNHPRIREALFQVFSTKNNRHIAEIVADTLHSPQLSVKSLAMEILRGYGSDAIYPLKRLTKSDNNEIRKIAADLLGDISDQSAANILLELLHDDCEKVILAAIEGLGKQKEIKAVRELLDYYDKYKNLRPVILNALGKIFLYWEKFIIRSELLDADPILASSLVDSVQENGNASIFNLMIHWLQNNQMDMGEEIIKGIAAILLYNPNLVLPISILEKILNEWAQHSEDIPLSVYLTCLSRIPSNRSFNEINRYYQDSPNDIDVKQSIIDFLKRFQTIFFNRYFQLHPKFRQTLIQLMINEDVAIYENQLLQIYSEVRDKNERKSLLKLAVKNRMPAAKQLLLARFSENSTEQLKETLVYLCYYHDESLWPLYLKYFDHPDKTVREAAGKGLLSYPDRTFTFLHQLISKKNNKNAAHYLSLVMKLPVRLANNIFETWLLSPSENKIKSLSNYLLETKESQYILLFAKSLLSHPKKADLLFSKLSKSELKVRVPSAVKEFWSCWSKRKQTATLDLVKKYWNEEFDDLQVASNYNIESFEKKNYQETQLLNV